jgi:hypothetical protein
MATEAALLCRLDARKHFWAFAVGNYEDKRVQVLPITQKTLRDAMFALMKNPKWGDP